MRIFTRFTLAVLALMTFSCSKSRDAEIVPVPTQASFPSNLSAPGAEKAKVQCKQITSVAKSISIFGSKPVSLPTQLSFQDKLSNGSAVLVQCMGGKSFIEVEGTYTKESFGRISAAVASLSTEEKNKKLETELSLLLKGMGEFARTIEATRDASVGYFSVLIPYETQLFSNFSDQKLRHPIALNPVVYAPDVVKAIKDNMLTLKQIPTAAYSGLREIKAPEFVEIAEKDIGGTDKVNGSSVKLGITDTGITYNHPTFVSKTTGKNKIVYLKDFTKEGTFFFQKAPSLVVKASEEDAEAVSIDAKLLVGPKLPDRPLADRVAAVEGVVLKVSPELKKALLATPDKFRLGAVLEQNLQAERDPVDLNANGKKDDIFPALLSLENPKEAAIYVDFSAEGDLRNVKPLRDFNKSGDTSDVFAEKIGVHIDAMKIGRSDSDATEVVLTASIVGYDPGNHGTHVAGIAAGTKTIQNDADDTLARGVAPEAQILMNRVCANNGGCNASQAIIDLVKNAKADVINMSLGGLSPINDGYDVEDILVNRLTSVGNTLFMISAGNEGPGRQTLGSPSTARLSMSVGASANKELIQKQYLWNGSGAKASVEESFMLFFSSRGPTSAGGFKPNLVAPGTELSSIQLNAADGARGGLDVYWGTSMSAPTATGAFTLFLDAVRKYNLAHPEQVLSTDVLTLRNVLIESATAFDTDKDGQYTWMDQGAGMLNLPNAWAKLKALRDANLQPSVQLGKTGVELDYTPLISITSANGIPYDGSRSVKDGPALFGTGLALRAGETATLYPMNIQRALPEVLAASPFAGELTRQLLTTRDEFVLKTVYSGKTDKQWLKAGVRSELECLNAETTNLSLIGNGVEISREDDGRTTLNAFPASVLNLCVDRKAINEELAPGDYGALVYAYRKVGDKVSPVSSFVIPVSLTVPHQILANNKGFSTQKVIKSFGVDRHYVEIPANTSTVKIRLEVLGETCGGVEIMGLQGNNTNGLFETRKEARVSSCDANGKPIAANKRVLTFTQFNPKAGVWDLHIFGSYLYAETSYHLSVDYVTASTSVKSIKGGEEALSGNFNWKIKESSLTTAPSAFFSEYRLDGLYSAQELTLQNKEKKNVADASGKVLRSYSPLISSVTVTTTQSDGNDIDLYLLECPIGTEDPNDSKCKMKAGSGGATADERINFTPEADKLYVVVADAYKIAAGPEFVSEEMLKLRPEKGTLEFAAGSTPGETLVKYTFDEKAKAASVILNSSYFKSKQYQAFGGIDIRGTDKTLYSRIPVLIQAN